jgi:hypothetical protein
MDDAKALPTSEEFSSIALSKRQQAVLQRYLNNRGELIDAARNTATKKKGKARFKRLKNGQTKALYDAWMQRLKSYMGKDQFERMREYICNEIDFCNRKKTYDLFAWIVSTVIGIIGGLHGAIAGLLFILLNWHGEDFCDCKNKSTLKII